MVAAATVAPGTGTEVLLARLTRPYDAARAVAALSGRSLRTAHQVVGVALATSDEAEGLLDAMPRIVRSLAIATTDRPERCYGELRGPIMWSETMSARSASAGDPGLWVCATTTKAYDTDENRVLKAALAAIERAGRDASAGSASDASAAGALRRARHNELRARHVLEHRTLSGVPVTRVSQRALQRTRAGSRRSTYAPAVALLLAAAAPVQALDLASVLTDEARAGHDLMAATIVGLDAAGRGAPLRTSSGTLVAGDARYAHGRGVTLGGRPIRDLADLDAALA